MGWSSSTKFVDPHGAHLAHALPKLKDISAFADAYGDRFVRIESIAEVSGAVNYPRRTRAPDWMTLPPRSPPDMRKPTSAQRYDGAYF